MRPVRCAAVEVRRSSIEVISPMPAPGVHGVSTVHLAHTKPTCSMHRTAGHGLLAAAIHASLLTREWSANASLLPRECSGKCLKLQSCMPWPCAPSPCSGSAHHPLTMMCKREQRSRCLQQGPTWQEDEDGALVVLAVDVRHQLLQQLVVDARLQQAVCKCSWCLLANRSTVCKHQLG